MLHTSNGTSDGGNRQGVPQDTALISTELPTTLLHRLTGIGGCTDSSGFPVYTSSLFHTKIQTGTSVTIRDLIDVGARRIAEDWSLGTKAVVWISLEFIRLGVMTAPQVFTWLDEGLQSLNGTSTGHERLMRATETLHRHFQPAAVVFSDLRGPSHQP